LNIIHCINKVVVMNWSAGPLIEVVDWSARVQDWATAVHQY